MNIGITGVNGFLGYHISNGLLYSDRDYNIISFSRNFFDNSGDMDVFVKSCDVIIHLAGINRSDIDDDEFLYDLNLGLTKNLIESLIRTESKSHVIFTSSIHEVLDNAYGRSKRDSRRLLSSWSREYSGAFSGLIVPNIFGPFCKPFYNSVVATFCHQLCNNGQPEVLTNNEIELLYVGDFVKIILSLIDSRDNTHTYKFNETHKIDVAQLLDSLITFHEFYFDKSEIPNIRDSFDLNLFNTYRSYIDISSKFPKPLKTHEDDRGIFAETARFLTSGQTSYSVTKPGIIRGNHFHTRKMERFIVLRGKALIELRKIGSDQKQSFYLDHSNPSFVDMPIWYTHNLRNIGDEDLITIFWINEPFDEDNPDTYYEIV